MGVSIDPKKMERLSQLEEVLTLLQNPEEYNRMIAEVQSVLQQQKDITRRYDTVDAAERYLAEAKRVTAKAAEERDALRESLNIEIYAFTTLKTTKEAELVEREAKVKRREDQVTNREVEIKRREMDFDEVKRSFSKEREKRWVELAKRESDLETKEKILDKKLQDLQRIMA